MSCRICKEKPVIQLPNSEVRLCKSCFIKYFERKTLKTIRQHKLIKKRDHVVCALSVAGETPILIEKNKEIEIKQIKEIYKLIKNNYKINVLTIDKNFNVCFKKIRSALKHKTNDLYNLKYTGGNIKTTGSHSVFIFENGKIIPKRVDSLKIGDYLVTFLNAKKREIKKEIFLHKSNYVKDSGFIKNRIPDKIKITKELMNLFGYYVAEGHTTPKKRNWSISFTFNISEKKQQEDVIRLIRRYFKLEPKYINSNIEKNSLSIEYSNKELSQLLKNLLGSNAKNKQLPPFVYFLKKEFIVEFLRGYKGDSHTRKRYRGNGTIVFKTRSEKLANQIIYLLRLNGIACNFTKEFNKGHLSPQKIWVKGGRVHMIEIPAQFNPFFKAPFSYKTPSSDCMRIPSSILKAFHKPKPKNLERIAYKLIYDRVRTNKTINKKDSFYFIKELTKNKKLNKKQKEEVNSFIKLCLSELGCSRIRKISKENYNNYVYDISVPNSEAFFGGVAPILLHNSGGKDSLSLLYLLNKIESKNIDIKLSALLIDEGIKGYRDETIKTAKNFCQKNNIQLHIASYKEITGKTLDNIKKQFPDTIACNMCGVLRRYILNKKSRELKADKLATGHNLDDETQSIIMNQLKNNIALSARLGPITGVKKDKRFVPRIKPFYFITEKEIASYAFLNGLMDKFNECTYCTESNRFVIRDMLNNLEQKYPGTKHSIVASFLEILPILKEKYKGQKINSCRICSEPASSEICSACNLLQKIK